MKNRNKDKKPHESIIGKIIYGFLLFMPLLAIGVTCAYAIFNKNAYQSYSDEYVEKIQNVTDSNMFIQNNNYLFNPKTFFDYTNDTYVNAGKIKYNTISLNWNDILGSNFQLTPQQLEQVNGFVFYHGTSTDLRLNLYKDDTLIKTAIQSTIAETRFKNLDKTFYFNFNSLQNWNIGSYPVSFNSQSLKEIILVTDKIDNVFYYSIDKVQQSPLFNWAEDSLIYTGMTNTCNALNITTPFIPLLMTYWLIISVIYILYDIILVILHIFHKKIHQLEDSF